MALRARKVSGAFETQAPVLFELSNVISFESESSVRRVFVLAGAGVLRSLEFTPKRTSLHPGTVPEVFLDFSGYHLRAPQLSFVSRRVLCVLSVKLLHELACSFV